MSKDKTLFLNCLCTEKVGKVERREVMASAKKAYRKKGERREEEEESSRSCSNEEDSSSSFQSVLSCCLPLLEEEEEEEEEEAFNKAVRTAFLLFDSMEELHKPNTCFRKAGKLRRIANSEAGDRKKLKNSSWPYSCKNCKQTPLTVLMSLLQKSRMWCTDSFSARGLFTLIR